MLLIPFRPCWLIQSVEDLGWNFGSSTLSGLSWPGGRGKNLDCGSLETSDEICNVSKLGKNTVQSLCSAMFGVHKNRT